MVDLFPEYVWDNDASVENEMIHMHETHLVHGLVVTSGYYHASTILRINSCQACALSHNPTTSFITFDAWLRAYCYLPSQKQTIHIHTEIHNTYLVFAVISIFKHIFLYQPDPLHAVVED